MVVETGPEANLHWPSGPATCHHREVTEGQSIELRQDWSAAADEPLRLVNTMAAQLMPPVGPAGAPDGIQLILGHATSPVLLGSPEDIVRMLESFDGRVPVTVVGQFVLSKGRAQELIEVLQRTVEQFEQAELATQGRGGGGRHG